jgi:hypothetical protein
LVRPRRLLGRRAPRKGPDGDGAELITGTAVARALARPPGRELSLDVAFAARVRRLAAVSAVALGVLLLLWLRTVEAPTAFAALLGGGWLTMPLVLLASLRRPRLRYALVVPSTFVSLPVGAAAVGLVSTGSASAQAGWALVACGVALGAVMGAWFWFRLLPVPRALDHPFSAARWALVAVHVALIVAGAAVVAAAA